MSKRLIDVDDEALQNARKELGTRTIKDTVNQALRLASLESARSIERSLDVLASVDFEPRDQAWR